MLILFYFICLILARNPTNFHLLKVELLGVEIPVVFLPHIFFDIVVLEIGECWNSLFPFVILWNGAVSLDDYIELGLDWGVVSIEWIFRNNLFLLVYSVPFDRNPSFLFIIVVLLLVSWFRIYLVFLVYFSIVHIIIVGVLMAGDYFLFAWLNKFRRGIVVVHLFVIFVFYTFAGWGWMLLFNWLLRVDIVLRGEGDELTAWGKVRSEGVKAKWHLRIARMVVFYCDWILVIFVLVALLWIMLRVHHLLLVDGFECSRSEYFVIFAVDGVEHLLVQLLIWWWFLMVF